MAESRSEAKTTAMR
jgi:hypothetical protein